jgi:hypothetical protein
MKSVGELAFDLRNSSLEYITVTSWKSMDEPKNQWMNRKHGLKSENLPYAKPFCLPVFQSGKQSAYNLAMENTIKLTITINIVDATKDLSVRVRRDGWFVGYYMYIYYTWPTRAPYFAGFPHCIPDDSAHPLTVCFSRSKRINKRGAEKHGFI